MNFLTLFGLICAALPLIQVGCLGITEKEQREKHLRHILPKSRGRPFPQPQYYVSTDTQHVLDERAFAFQYASGSVVCEILSSAFNRYYKIIFQPQLLDFARGVRRARLVNKPNPSSRSHPNRASLLKRVLVNIKTPCEDYPSLESDESCIRCVFWLNNILFM